MHCGMSTLPRASYEQTVGQPDDGVTNSMFDSAESYNDIPLLGHSPTRANSANNSKRST